MNVPHIDRMNAGGDLPLLSVRNLRVEFPRRRGTLVALDDVSFDIARGEVLGVVGESGAGKSLTGAAIIGLLEPPGRIAGGDILLDGEAIHALRGEAMPPPSSAPSSRKLKPWMPGTSQRVTAPWTRCAK